MEVLGVTGFRSTLTRSRAAHTGTVDNEQMQWRIEPERRRWSLGPAPSAIQLNNKDSRPAGAGRESADQSFADVFEASVAFFVAGFFGARYAFDSLPTMSRRLPMPRLTSMRCR